MYEVLNWNDNFDWDCISSFYILFYSYYKIIFLFSEKLEFTDVNVFKKLIIMVTQQIYCILSYNKNNEQKMQKKTSFFHASVI